MNARLSCVSVAAGAMLAIAAACPADTNGYRPGKGGIGVQMGGSSIVSEADYSAGASPRFAFDMHWRYAVVPWLRWQISPGFTWGGYSDQGRAPFREKNFPADSTKANYLTLLLPISAQLQFTSNRGPWLYYAGAGPGIYRVWVENHRKVVEDPASHKLHRGVYPGATFQVGAERFLKALPSTSVEVSLDAHYVLARRDAQFPSGWNSKLVNVGIRVGGNYYFVPNPAKKKEEGAGGVAPTIP